MSTAEKLAEALDRVKFEAVSLADAQVIALEALAEYRAQPAADGAQRVERMSAEQELASRWSKLPDADVLLVAPIAMPLGWSKQEEEGFCAGFRRCAGMLSSAWGVKLDGEA